MSYEFMNAGKVNNHNYESAILMSLMYIDGINGVHAHRGEDIENRQD